MQKPLFRFLQKKTSEPKGRIIFLDYLRAIACLLVVLGHVYFMGLNGYEAIQPYVPSVTANIFGPDSAQRNVLSVPAIQVGVHAGINVGYLGVAIFFLISGFVILRAVDSEKPLDFLIRRAFRIYPVSMGAVLFTGAITAIYCLHTDTHFPHSISSIISSGFIANGFLHYMDVVPVLWSLEVELFFYILLAVLAAFGKITQKWILIAGIVCLIFTCAVNAEAVKSILPGHIAEILVHLSFDTLHISFLLIGSMIYRANTGRDFIRNLTFVVLAIALFLLSLFGYRTLHGNAGGVDVANGAWALLIFSAALWSGMNWRWVRPLLWIAKISYPLYLIHIPLAWICLAWLASLGLGMLLSSILVAPVLLIFAWILHLAIEEPARRLGRDVSRKLLPKLNQAVPVRIADS